MKKVGIYAKSMIQATMISKMKFWENSNEFQLRMDCYRSIEEITMLLNALRRTETTLTMEIIIWTLVFVILYAVIGAAFGLMTNKILENKGYTENWFWYGFFFGGITILLALSKPARYNGQDLYVGGVYVEPAVKTEDMWKCAKCGRFVTGYSCACGMFKGDNTMFLKKQAEQEKQVKAEAEAKQEKLEAERKEFDNINKVKAYKELLDAGIISSEEFEKKKQELLNL